jgi:menaquinone-specific isochorismate synthase
MITLIVGGDNPHDVQLKASARIVSEGYLRAAYRLAKESGRVLERDGLCIATLGTAVSIRYPNGIIGSSKYATELLTHIAAKSDDPWISPICLGALTFDLTSENQLVIPEITVITRADEQPIGLYVGSISELKRLVERDLEFEVRTQYEGVSHEPPDQFTLAAVVAHDVFKEKVNDAVHAIGAGELDKVVLAREVVITGNRPFRQADLFNRLRALHPSCLAFAIDGFIGATPELLIKRSGMAVNSVPLAGTIARSGDPDEDTKHANALMDSRKDRAEHQFVVQAIGDALSPIVETRPQAPPPHILELRNVVHLATSISATLKNASTTSLDLVTQIHPTPAVCGMPIRDAFAYIGAHEGFERDHYAGVVGYTDLHGDGEWWLGIRSAIVNGDTARIFAGVGVVAESEPTKELAETQLKLQAMLAVLVRP